MVNDSQHTGYSNFAQPFNAQRVNNRIDFINKNTVKLLNIGMNRPKARTGLLELKVTSSEKACTGLG